MAFQQNAFQHNAFQVQVSDTGAAVRMRSLMGVGLGIRMLAASQLKNDLTRRQLFKTFAGIFYPWKGK